MEAPLCLFVDVPICAFRPHTSREYQDTYPVPPPSAVFGMLLSLVGVAREEKARHRGVEMALAVEECPLKTKVFRKLRRGKTLTELRPDYQDLLLDLRLWVWLQSGHDRSTPSLPQRVAVGLTSPSSLTRFGGLSLGESSYLVNSISTKRRPPDQLVFVRPNPNGFHSLPVWVDHEANKSRLPRFSLDKLPVPAGIHSAWIEISE